MRPLVLCQSCKRHVKQSDPTCPFCGTTVRESAVRGGLSRGRPGGRAALFLAGGALVPACAVESAPDDQDDDADGGDASTGDAGRGDGGPMAVPVYGVAIDSGFIAVPPYGIAIPDDAGAPDAAVDASCPQVGNLPVPVYGVPVDAGTRPNQCGDAGTDAGEDIGMAIPPYGVSIDRDR